MSARHQTIGSGQTTCNMDVNCAGAAGGDGDSGLSSPTLASPPAPEQQQQLIQDDSTADADTDGQVDAPLPPPTEQQQRPAHENSGGSLLSTYAPLLLSRSASANASAASVASSMPHTPQVSILSSSSSHASSELVHQLQRLCSRQRQRSEERQFVRDVERVLALLRQQAHAASAHAHRSRTFTLAPSSSSASASASGLAALSTETRGHSTSLASSTAVYSFYHQSQQQPHYSQPLLQHTPGSLTAAEIELLIDCIAGLFEHRNYDVRAVAFETVTLCLSHYGEQLSSVLRAKVFALLAEHPAGDYVLRQKALRVLTHDGRNVAPFHVELGWLLLRLLDESDEQRDLIALIQSILRRSPLGLDREAVIALTHVVCSRCDAAWTRGDTESCRKFLSFFHVLATHGLEYAASTSGSLRTLCCLVNADGHGTWSIMKHLLNGSAGYHVLRGLVQLLEHPHGSSEWVLRGAVFFVGMSCWGSQRVGKLDDVKWAPILLALERVLACNTGVVIFEVILALQRLIKKFGAATKSEVESTTRPGASEKRLIVEWDIILRMFRELRPWLSLADDMDSDDGDGYNGSSNVPSMMTHPQPQPASTASSSHTLPGAEHQSFAVSIHQTRIPRELLDTLSVVEDLVAQRTFAGDVEDFYDVLEDYLPHLNEGSTLFLLRHRAESSHPAYHVQWLQNLSDAMLSFFTNASMLGAVRLEALDVLRLNLHCSRNICEDRVIEDVVVPTLNHVYDDHHADVRRRGLDLVTEVARQLESVKFDALLDILANAVTLALYEDAQVYAISGIVSLFSSCFDHLPHSRTLRMYELITKVVETHRNADVRRIALTCLLHVCEADGTYRLQWRDAQVRTSRFLYVARRAVQSPQTGAFVPVTRGLRAMLTLVSTETHADLFRMAVGGIRVMLENRIVLTDVDISDMTLKIISSIDYRAFGRAAIPDELANMTDDDTTAASTGPAERVRSASAWDARRAQLHPTDADAALRSIRTAPLQRSRASGSSHDTGLFKSSLRDTLVVLCKTRFMTMGLELLALLTSYARELHTSARHHLIACLVGALELQLAVADKDLLSGPSASSTELLPKTRSAIDLGRDDDRYNARMDHQQQQVQLHHRTRDRHDAALESSSHHRRSHATAAKPASPPHFGFTSRMLSRFQTSSSHGNLFHHVLSSSSSSTASAKPSQADLEARARLQQTLQALYDAEFAMLHLCTNVLSLLALRMTDDVAVDLALVLESARLCFTTPDGDFRADGYGAALEMVANIVYTLPTLDAQHYEDVIELLLLGLDYATSKHLAYVAFRLLCHVIFKCAPRDRIALASLALPRLQQVHVRRNSLLIEAAIDFLMSFAFSRSFPPPPALCSSSSRLRMSSRSVTGPSDAHERDPDAVVVQSRSWVYKNSILTIDVTARGTAKLVVRRANCTNHWDLHLAREGVADPRAVRPVLASIDSEEMDDDSTALEGKRSDDACEQPEVARDESRVTESIAHNGSSTSVERHAVDENTATQAPQQSDSETSTAPSAIKSTTSTPTAAAMSLPPPVPITHDALAASGSDPSARKKWSSSRKQVSFALAGSSPTIFPHASASLPPLPAYDGIGGSPSYFCEAHPGTSARCLWCSTVRVADSRSTSFSLSVTLSCSALVRRRNELRMLSAAARSARDASSMADGSASPFDDRHALMYDGADDEDDDGPDGFSLDGTSLQPLSARAGRATSSDRSRLSQSQRSAATTTATTAGSSTCEDGDESTTASTRDNHETSTSTASAAADATATPPTSTLDPMFLMMQLFDVTVESRPQLLTNGSALSLGLSVLDRTPAYETHKIGLLYVRNPKQRAESDVLGNTGGSVRYLKFLRGLGTFTKLEGLSGYSGGLDTANNSDGKFGLIYKDDYTQVRCATS